MAIDHVTDPKERLLALLLSIGGLMEQVSNRQVFKQFDLSSAQYEVLQVLAGRSGPVNLSDLSRLLVVWNANVTGLIDRMEGQGLVKRKTMPADGRVRLIEITAAGRTKFKQAHAAHVDGINEFLMTFSDEDIRDILKPLQILYMRAEAAATGIYKLRCNPERESRKKKSASGG